MIFYLSKSITLYVVYVWGGRCGREVPHFDSRPVSISDPRVGMTPLGLFGPEPDGNGPCLWTSCRANLCSIGLVVATKTISLCPSKDLEMLIHEKRYEKFERTHIYGTRATHENTSVSYSCKGTISWQLGQLITMFIPHITRKIGIFTKRLSKAFVSIHI